jgi:hypothetical protein
VVDLWKNARIIGASKGGHHLRWVPQSPFDVLSFDGYWDEGRDVEAQHGYSICRTSEDHRLGFLRESRCQSVEDTDAPVKPDDRPVPISAYHAGRCLDVKNTSLENGARVEQRACNSGASQLWEVHSSSFGIVSISNVHSGKCLAMPRVPISTGTNAVQQTCTDTSKNQRWHIERTGNTFHLMPEQSGLCLEVRDQSRENRAKIVLANCSTASNQLWVIDSLRKRDFERLYQEDKNRYAWQTRATAEFPLAVSVDGSRSICSSRDSELWIGVVIGNSCVGKSYAGTAVTTVEFDGLYQAR